MGGEINQKGLGIEMVRIRIADLGRENHQFIFKKQLAGFKLVYHIHQGASDGAVGISQRHGGRANPKTFLGLGQESQVQAVLFSFFQYFIYNSYVHYHVPDVILFAAF